jgi:RNA polymerase sigma-70 factor (ECF subfamily)
MKVDLNQATDEGLMVRYQGGDREAFTILVRRHRHGLFQFACRHTGASQVAEEIVQEAFVRVVQNAGDFRRDARFSTWVYTIARNLCVDHLRKRALRRHPSLDAPIAGEAGGSGDDAGDGPSLGERTKDPGAGVEREATRHEIGARIASAVEALPEEQREVFLLRELSDLPFKAIAEVTGAPENTVKSRMRYALERLQQALCSYEEYARALR